jgi:hypothetical protein
MGIRNLNFFDNDDNYIYDASKIEFTGSVAKLKPTISGAGALAYWKLDHNKGLVALDSTINGNHGAFQGGYTENQWTTGKINSAIKGLSSTNGFINFDQLISFERTDPFSIEFWIKFTSTTSQIIISKQVSIGVFEGFLVNAVNGNIRFVIRDVNGNILAIETVNTYNDNVFHHIVATYDGSSIIGGLNLYVDNVLDTVINTALPLDSTIINTSNFQLSGRDGNNNTLLSSTIIDEVVIYDREISVADITFRWNGGAGTQVIPGATTSFPTDNPTITNNGSINVTEFIDFDSTNTIVGSDNVFYTLLVDSVEYYWNGIEWTISTGYPNVNTPLEIKTNIANFIIADISKVSIKRYMHSDNGTTTPELQEDYFDYNYIPEVINLTFATIRGNIFDFDGTTSQITIQVQTVREIIGSTTKITSNLISVPYDTITGAWEIDLYYEDVEPVELRWFFGNTQIVTNFLTGINNFNDLTVV